MPWPGMASGLGAGNAVNGAERHRERKRTTTCLESTGALIVAKNLTHRNSDGLTFVRERACALAVRVDM